MGSLVVIQFWTMANDVFHAREAKRLFGLIGAGGTLANVIFGLLVSRYARRIGAPNLLWLMVVQLASCALLARAGARLISTAPLIAGRRARRTVPVLSRAGLAFLGNRHLLLIAGVAAVSAAAVTVVDFQFKLAAASVLRQNDLAGYFGRFYGICGGIALAVQIWITGRLLERYGILASLLPLPAGLALGSGFSAAVPNPGLFVASLAKGSDTIFRYTINDASMQLLYVPVQPSMRGRAKAFIDGILKPTAIALTGVVLLFYKQSFGKGRPLTLAVLLLVALWILLLLRARQEYVRSLVESLERRHLDLHAAPLAASSEATVRTLRAALRADAPTALHAIALLQHVPGVDFSAELRDLLAHGDPRIRAGADARVAVGQEVPQLGGEVHPGHVLQQRDGVQGGGRVSPERGSQRAHGGLAGGGERGRVQVEGPALEGFDQAAHGRLHGHVEQLHRGVVDGVTEDGVGALGEAGDEQPGVRHGCREPGPQGEPGGEREQRGEDPVSFEQAPGDPDLHRQRDAPADPVEAAEVAGQIVLPQHGGGRQLELEVHHRHRGGAHRGYPGDQHQVAVPQEGEPRARQHGDGAPRAPPGDERSGGDEPRPGAGQERAGSELRDHEPEEVRRADAPGVARDEQAEDDVRERAPGADQAEEPFRLARMEDVAGHGPELDHDQRGHRLDEDVERRVDPAADVRVDERPEGSADRRAARRRYGVERAARHLVGDASVAVREGHDGGGGKDEQPGKSARGAVREVQRVAHRAPDHHRADRARCVRGHDRGAALLAGPDAQSGLQCSFQPAWHGRRRE